MCVGRNASSVEVISSEPYDFHPNKSTWWQAILVLIFERPTLHLRYSNYFLHICLQSRLPLCTSGQNKMSAAFPLPILKRLWPTPSLECRPHINIGQPDFASSEVLHQIDDGQTSLSDLSEFNQGGKNGWKGQHGQAQKIQKMLEPGNVWHVEFPNLDHTQSQF